MLNVGTKLGTYEITAGIGAGGMGEVYQAHDTKLGRDVAIKVLPDAFARDPERLARFQREAKMLASLNHPNIAAIYGLEEDAGRNYLVMELVPGETLAERVKREGPVPIEESLAIAKQIAEALEAAHEKSIIHRDLKPANVKVTPEDKVKVLDFGLAKAFAGDSANEDPSNSPTLSRAATMQGVIMGTAAYMSPEQARGKSVDKRTDLWAFGAVLYELLTGKQAFHGDTTTELLAAVLKGEPDWQALPEPTSPSVRALLRRCLQKEVNRRVRDAADVRIEIEEAQAAPAKAEPTDAAIGFHALRRRALLLSVGTLLLGAVVTGLAVWNLKPAPAPLPQPVSRVAITLPPGQKLASVDFGPAVAVSPDGTHLAYVARQGGTQQLYLRSMNSFDAKPIPGTDGAESPFFSPDGQWIGFFAEGKLRKVSLSGGAALTLCSAPANRGASWGPGDTIIFAPSFSSGLFRVSAAGGTPKPLTTPEHKNGEISHRWPEILPDGKAVLFTIWAGTDVDDLRIGVVSLETGERRVLVEGGTYARYVPPGYMVYARAGGLLAVPFDLKRLEVHGAAVPIVEGVGMDPVFGAAEFSPSADGSIAYVPRVSSGGDRTLVWVDRRGAAQPLAAPPREYTAARLSPDGKRVALAIEGANPGVWLYDLARGTLTRLIETAGTAWPVWTPDGGRLAFRLFREGSFNIFWMPADGSGTAERLTASDNVQVPGSWSPDGQVLAFSESDPTTGTDIEVLRLGGDRKPQHFLQTQSNEAAPMLSPDGHWLAYQSNESGRMEIYVRPFPGPGGKTQVSNEGGMQPLWVRNGRELFYRDGDKMIAAAVETEPSFTAAKPKLLFEGHYETAAVFPAQANYDMSLDGQRFLMVKEGAQEQAPTQINVVLNWFEELKQKVPAGKK